MRKEQVALFAMYLSSTVAFSGSIFLFNPGYPLGYVRIIAIFIGLIFSIYHVTETCIRLLKSHDIDTILQKRWYIRSTISVVVLFISAYLVGML